MTDTSVPDSDVVPWRGRAASWFVIGLLAALLCAAIGVGVSRVFEYDSDELAAWAGPMLGLFGYLASIVVVPVVALVVERARSTRRGAMVAAAFLGTLALGVLAVIALFVVLVVVGL